MLDDNLRAPLDDAALAEFQRGSELTPGASAARTHVLALLVGGARRERVRVLARPRPDAARCRRSASPGPAGHGSRSRSRCRQAWPAIRRPSTWRCTGPTAAASPSRASSPNGLTPQPRGKRVFKDKYFAQGARSLGGRRLAALPSARRGAAGRPRAGQVPQRGAALEARARLGEERAANEHARVPLLRLAGQGSGDASRRARPRRGAARARASSCASRRIKRCSARCATRRGSSAATSDYLAQRYFA